MLEESYLQIYKYDIPYYSVSGLFLIGKKHKNAERGTIYEGRITEKSGIVCRQ